MNCKKSILAYISLFFIIYTDWVWRFLEGFISTGIPYHYIVFFFKVALISCFILELMSLKINSSAFLISSSAFVLFFLLFFVIIINIDVFGYTRNGDYINGFAYNWNTVISMAAYFCVGFYIAGTYSGDDFRRYLSCCYFTMTFLVLLYSNFNTLSLDYSSLINTSFSHYTYLADLYCVLSFFFISKVFADSKFFYLGFLLILTLVTLILLNSRSAIVIFIISFYLLLVIDSKVSNIKKCALIISPFIFFLILPLFVEFLSSNFEINNRLLNLFTLNFSDRSFDNREAFLEFGLIDIQNNWFLGNFGGQLEGPGDNEGVRWGTYIHNGLSFWRQFGLIAFLIIVVLICKSLSLALKARNNTLLLLVLYTILCYLISRSYMNYYLFISIGFAAGIVSERSENNVC